jgi:hypothetical protein
MRLSSNPVVRTPQALFLGWAAFTVGFFRLVVMSTRFTTRMIRGISPEGAVNSLGRGKGIGS